MAIPALLIVMAILVLLMQICVRKIAWRLRDRHPETFNEIGMEDLAGELPRSEDSGPTSRLIAFCWRRDYLALKDRELSRLGGYLRALILVWPCLFVAFGFTMFRQSTDGGSQARSVQARSPAEKSAPGAARERAFNLHRAGKLDEAIQAYDTLLRTRGPDAEVLYWRAMAFGKANQPEMALQDARRVIEMEPTNLDASRLADGILRGQQRWDEAIKVWDRYIAIARPNEEAYFARSAVHLRRGDIAAARSDAVRSCELGKPQACGIVERLKGR